VDDGFYLTLPFDDGAVGTVEVGTCNYIPLPRFYIKGEFGTAIIDDWRNNMRVVRDKLNGPAKDQKPVETAAGLTKTMAPRTEETVTTWEEERPQSDVHDFYRNFCAAIDGTEEQLVKHDENRRVMKIIEASFESAEKNQVIHRVI
jgi:predicted dehydrogenase